MEPIKSIFFFVFFLIFNHLSSQNGDFTRAGLIRAQATISPSKMFQGAAPFYLHGNLEAYLSDRVSASGEVYYYLGEMSTNKIFQYHHSLFFGANYHFSNGGHDFYFGFQPGISLTKTNTISLTPEKNNQIGINPLMAFVVGYQYDVNGFFHFFVQNRFVLGNHVYFDVKNLGEYRFSAGLGFHLNVLR